MSVSEEDIQASAKVTNLRPRSMANDSAHYFRNRTVLQLFGDLFGLSAIAACPPPGPGQRARFVPLLDEDGCLAADLHVIPTEDGALIDVHADLAESVAQRLAAIPGVTAIDRAAGERWRVLGELPDQKPADTAYETIRFSDPRRRELGARVLRDAAEPEGMDWRHARKWDGHAMRLGLLPDHRCIIGKSVKPAEAGYHRLLGGVEGPPAGGPTRRVLPMRVNIYDPVPAIPAATPILAGGAEIGVLLDQEGVCAIALVSIEPWRNAVAEGMDLSCAGLPVLITWPTWLASESEGRVGPAAGLI